MVLEVQDLLDQKDQMVLKVDLVVQGTKGCRDPLVAKGVMVPLETREIQDGQDQLETKVNRDPKEVKDQQEAQEEKVGLFVHAAKFVPNLFKQTYSNEMLQ